MKNINLSNEQHSELVNALEYAVEQRHYEATCTSDKEDFESIHSCAKSWERLLEVVRNSQEVPEVDPKKPLNLHLMTIPQLAEYIASKLNYSRIWKSEFPACDFAIVDVQQKQYNQEALECIHSGASGWYGIQSANVGFDSTSLFAVADIFGGGCDQVCRLYDGIGVIEAEILLQDAIRNALECCETVTDKTLLIVELLDKEAPDNA